MSQVFISYSRVDTAFAELIVDRLRRVYGLPNVWYDDELHGGQRWWKTILEQIAACDVFVYLLSNDSVTSPYCQAEFAEALRLQKPIVTVQIRDKTRLSAELNEIQYVDMKRGLNDDNLARLIRSINELAALPKKRRALSSRPTTLPSIPDSDSEDGAMHADVETPTLAFQPSSSGGDRVVARATILNGVIVGVLGLIGVIVAAVITNLNNPSPILTSTAAPSVQVADALSPTLTEPPSTATPSMTPTATDDLAATQAAEFQASLTALAVMQLDRAQTTAADTATADAIAITLAVLGETATQQSIEASRTRNAEIAFQNITATANALTDTPMPTSDTCRVTIRSLDDPALTRTWTAYDYDRNPSSDRYNEVNIGTLVLVTERKEFRGNPRFRIWSLPDQTFLGWIDEKYVPDAKDCPKFQ